MATKLKYIYNPCLFEDVAVVQKIQDSEDERKILILDQTIFYPRGGGQPYDVGKISNNKGIFNVHEVYFSEGLVQHYGVFEKGSFDIGDKVNLKIDKERRILNNKLHSAGHLIDSAVWNLGYTWKPTKGGHYLGNSFVEYEGEIDNEQKEQIKNNIQKEVNSLIKEGFEVKRLEVKKSELPKYCEDIPDYIPEGKPCSIAIVWGEKGTPCGGTHVKNIKDIGKINIRKLKCKKGIIKISYDLF